MCSTCELEYIHHTPHTTQFHIHWNWIWTELVLHFARMKMSMLQHCTLRFALCALNFQNEYLWINYIRIITPTFCLSIFSICVLFEMKMFSFCCQKTMTQNWTLYKKPNSQFGLHSDVLIQQFYTCNVHYFSSNE